MKKVTTILLLALLVGAVICMESTEKFTTEGGVCSPTTSNEVRGLGGTAPTEPNHSQNRQYAEGV